LKKLIIFGFAVVSQLASVAQNETNNWLFGNSGGMSFSSGSPLPLAGGVLTTSEGSTTASHPVTGDLLFYSDGQSVWNSIHGLMPSGTGLMGCSSSTMSALTLPQPGNPDIYYLFTTDCAENDGLNGFRYSIVDLTAAGGLGDVTSVNNLLFDPCGEVNSAVVHANCVDYWIIARELNNNSYRAYLLTAAGLSAPVITSIGVSAGPFHYGQGKFSPDGTKFAVADGLSTTVQLFDFNNATGVLSNAVTLFTSTFSDIPYGLSFSANSSKLYAGMGSLGEQLYQWDLSSGVAATMIASITLIGDVTPTYFPQLQLGKDHKIYIAETALSTMGVINNPDVAGLACGYVSNAVPIAGTNTLGVPAFPENYFNSAAPCATSPIVYAQNDDLVCNNDSSGIAWVSLFNITAPYTISWSPGGAATDSITGLGPGTYYVTVTDSAGVLYTDSVVIVQPAPLTASIYTANDSVCAGDSLTLSATGGGGTGIYTYQWISSSGTGTNSTYTFTPASSDTVSLTITDENNCPASSAISITVLPAAPLTASPDTCVCAGESVTISASGAPGYLWNTGQTTSSITVSPASGTTYVVSYSDGVCTVDEAVFVCVNPVPLIFISNDTTLIWGSDTPYALLFSGATSGSPVWSPATGLSSVTSANPTASPSETQIYTVTYTNSFGCSASATVIVTVEYIITVPNVYTPNGDGENETFYINGLPPSSEIIIYNRWGNLVFDSTSYQNDWSTPVDGVYYYILTIPDGKSFKGFVQVLDAK
jgi:gliding motility-associated-like protein